MKTAISSLISREHVNKKSWSRDEVKLQAHVNITFHNPFGHEFMHDMWNATDEAVDQCFGDATMMDKDTVIETLAIANQAAWSIATGD